MKNVMIGFMIAITFSLVLTSCELDDDTNRSVTISAKGIDSVQIGEVGALGEITEITAFFTRENRCEDFYGIDFQRVINERTVTLFTFKNTDIPCVNTDVLVSSRTIKFSPLETGNYTFRFWQSVDSDGENVFLEKEISIE